MTDPERPGRVDRRALLLATGPLVACSGPRRAPAEGSAPAAPPPPDHRRLDALLRAHSAASPELRGGVGINHYPMAAEVLEAFGASEAVEEAWIRAATGYDQPLGRTAVLTSDAERADALGQFERYGDWLDAFALELDARPWRTVVAHWCERLAPFLASATFHGVLRTGHAVRALTRRESPARRFELACGLAYWASRAFEIPVDASAGSGAVLRAAPEAPLRVQLASLAHPFDGEDVPAKEVQGRLAGCPVPPADALPEPRDPRTALGEIVREAAFAFLEMLVAKRHRVWMLHTVTGPAALDWILPHVSPRAASRLVREAQRAVLSMTAAFGEPFERGESLRAVDADWPSLMARAVESRSMHTLKLIDALQRFAQRPPSPVWASTADEYFRWT